MVPGSSHEFPECPAAFLRFPQDIVRLRVRRGGEPFAGHLVGGHTHLGPRVAQASAEVQSGARTLDTLPHKLAHLVMLYDHERAGAEAHEDDLREEERKRAGNGR